MLIGPLSGWPPPGSLPGGGLPRRRIFWDDCVAAATKESCSCVHVYVCEEKNVYLNKAYSSQYDAKACFTMYVVSPSH
jgi:hypothetical protein